MSHCLVNGIEADYVPVMDRGLHYGDGVFETLACVNGSVQFVHEHLARMRTGAERLSIPFPDQQLFMRDIGMLLASNDEARDCVIKLILTRGGGRRGYRFDPDQAPMRLCMRSAWPTHVILWKLGVRTRFCETPVSINPRLAGIKHLNRLDNVLASAELGKLYEEGFMLDQQGHVIEGTMSNVFAVIDGVLVTPDLANCGIRGIIRDKLLAIASAHSLPVELRGLTQHEVLGATELFICNSVLGICPVTQIAGQHKSHGEMTSMLDNSLNRLIKQDAQATE